MKIENGIIQQESSIGLISIDLKTRKPVSYCTKYKTGEISNLYTGIIFRCDIDNNGVTKNGWTFSTHFSEFIVDYFRDYREVIIDPETCIAWDERGDRVI